MNKYSNYILLFILLWFSKFDYSQCNIPSLVPNSDFELYSDCPGSSRELSKASGWHPVSSTTAGDYYNCSFTHVGATYSTPPAPSSGQGYIGLFNQSSGQKQYASACLSSNLLAGTEYFFQFDIAAAAGSPTSTFAGMTSDLIYTMVLYGSTVCPVPSYPGTGCPTPADGWQQIATATITVSATEWTTHTITFTPSSNFTGIAFGSDCSVASGGMCSGGFCYNNYYFDNVIINRNDLYPQVTAGTDVTNDCTTPTNVLNTNIQGGTPAYSYSWSPSTGLDNASFSAPTANPSSSTDYIVTITDGNGCEDKDTIQVIVDKTPPPANAGVDKSLDCSNPSEVLNGSGGVTYSWTPSTGLSSTTVANPTASPTSTTTYIMTAIGANGCTNTDTVIVNVDIDLPTVSTGPDITTSCSVPDAQLQASGGASYSWGPDFALSNANIANPTARPPYTTTYTVTVTGANGCQATGSTTVIINDVTPLAIAGTDISICGGSYATTLHVDTSVNLPTDIFEWEVDLNYPNGSNPNNIVIADATNPNSAISGFQEGVYRLFWTVTNPTSPCPPDTDTLLIKVYDPPSSDPGLDTSLCSIYELDLNAEDSDTIGSAVGTWSLDPSNQNPSSVTFADVHDPNTHISNLQEGTYRFIWKVTNGSCSPASDNVLVHIFDQPVANAGTDIDLCAIYSTSLGATIPAGTSTGIWSEPNNLTNPSAVNFSGVNMPATTVSNLIEGTYNIVWTLSNGTCPDSTDTVKVNVYDMPVSDAGTDVSVCGVDSLYLDTLSFLQANLPTGTATGLWTVDPTFVNASNTIAFIYPDSNLTPVTHLLEGQQQFVWTVSNGTCPDATDTVLISAYDRPLPYAGEDQSLCATYSVNMTANPPTGLATGLWTEDANFPNPSTIVFDNPTDATTNTTGYIEGTYRLLWTLSNGNCSPVSDTVIIKIYDTPIANAGEDIELCATYSTTLGALPPIGTATGIWTQDLNFGNPSTIAFADSSQYNTPTANYTEGSYQFIWTVSNGVCADSVDTVKVSIYDMPVANAGFDQYICDTDTTQMDGHGAIGTASGHWELDPNYTYPSIPLFRDATDSATWVDGLMVGDFEMVWIVENGVCPADTDRVMIIDQEKPVALAQYPLEVCDNKCFDVVSLSTTPPNTILGLYWELEGELSNDSVHEFCLYNVGDFPIKLVVIASNGCKDSLINNTPITVHSSPTAGFELSYDTDTLIELQRVDVIDLSSSDVIDYMYDMGTGDTVTGEGEFIYFFQNFGDYTVTQWVENQYGCRDSIQEWQRVEKRGTLFIPNTFTPNNDGLNDGFAPILRGVNPDTYEFAIFDRWGTMIFRSTDLNREWDGTYNGKYVKDGAYLWRVTYQFENSEEVNDKSGHVNVYKYTRE